MARHLSTKQLTSWLNGEIDHEEHDEHLSTCNKCAERIEEINRDTLESNVEAISAEIAPALLQILQPPADLHERVSERIAVRLQTQNDVNLFGSLLGVPVETAKIMSDDPLPSLDTSRSNTDED